MPVKLRAVNRGKRSRAIAARREGQGTAGKEGTAERGAEIDREVVRPLVLEGPDEELAELALRRDVRVVVVEAGRPVPTEVRAQDLRPARVAPDELCHIVHVAPHGDPAVRARPMLCKLRHGHWPRSWSCTARSC